MLVCLVFKPFYNTEGHVLRFGRTTAIAVHSSPKRILDPKPEEYFSLGDVADGGGDDEHRYPRTEPLVMTGSTEPLTFSTASLSVVV